MKNLLKKLKLYLDNDEEIIKRNKEENNFKM